MKKTLPKEEQRLAFWLPLPLDDKIKMIIAEHIDAEAEMMEMLLLEEIDWSNKGINKLGQLDVVLERALDNLTYEKY